MGLPLQGQYFKDAQEQTSGGSVKIDNKTIIKENDVLKVGSISWTQVIGLSNEFVDYTEFYTQIAALQNIIDEKADIEDLSAYLTIQAALLNYGRLSHPNEWLGNQIFRGSSTYFYGASVLFNLNGKFTNSSQSVRLCGRNNDLLIYNSVVGDYVLYNRVVDGVNVKELANVEFVNKSLDTKANKKLDNVSGTDGSKFIISTLDNSLNKSQGNLEYHMEPDGGNGWITTTPRKPLRSGTIIVNNKLNGTSISQIGNCLYGNWTQEVPEIKNSFKEVVLFLTPSTIPPYVVANNQDQNGYAARFDNSAYSNVDSSITIGLGINNQKVEGKLDSPITGYYQRSSNVYQLVQFSMYFELDNGPQGDFLKIYGQCSGRDRQIYLNLPTDQGPSDFAPQNYQISYAVYERERRVN